MKLDIFEAPLLLVILTVADEVLETVELELIVRDPRGLLDTTELPDTLAVIVLVFEPIDDLVKVAEALDVLEARDADTVVVVVEVFEEDAERVSSVCEGLPVIENLPLVVSEDVRVFETHAVTVEQAVVLSDRRPDKLIESVGLTVEVLQDEADGVIVREGRTVTDPLAVIVDVLEDGCVFVGVVLELGVFVSFAVTEPEKVLRVVLVIRPLELIVFEVVMLAVDVVVGEGVLVDKEHLDAVDEAEVVLEIVLVVVLVEVLRLVGEPF